MSLSPSAETWSFWRHVQLCLGMFAMESFISFEEIFMLATLQRTGVPPPLLSLPGTISSFIGVLVVPGLGWASDRFTCLACCGQKRPFALLTMSVMLVGLSILIGVDVATLYGRSDIINSHDNHAAVGNCSPSPPPLSTEAVPLPRDNTSVTVPSAQNGNSSGTLQKSISVLGVLGIASWALSDHGYDSSMSTFKAYMVAVTPASQHQNVFVMGTLMGAVGGCVTSLLGFLDLSVLFPSGTIKIDSSVNSGHPENRSLSIDGQLANNQTDCHGFISQGETVIDRGVAQCLVQTLILLLSVLLFGACSLLTGTETAYSEEIEVESNQNQDTNMNCEQECSALRSKEVSQNTATYDSTNQTIALQNTAVTKRQRCQKRIIVCLMTFFGYSANYAYFVYVTNYVGQMIYQGDPEADARSDAYARYVHGIHIGSLGMLTFYCLFVIFGFLHTKILNKIGMRLEFVGASVSCCVLMVTLAATNNIVVFFVNAVTMSVYRSAVYTIPYILVNNYAQQEINTDSTENSQQNATASGIKTASDSSGVDMASIGVMIPASYFVVSLLMGPLMDATGYPGFPILFAAASCLMGLATSFFVQFT